VGQQWLESISAFIKERELVVPFWTHTKIGY
jgi:hypothetical protein